MKVKLFNNLIIKFYLKFKKNRINKTNKMKIVTFNTYLNTLY